MDGMEAQVNIKQIKKEFEAELFNAENQNVSEGISTGDAVSLKSQLHVSKTASKFVCDIKNSLETKMLARGLDEDTANFVRDYLKTTDKEIELYQKILSEVGTEYLPEDYKAVLSKWMCSPIVLLIEHELERMITLRGMLKEFQSKKSKTEVAS